jgi:UDP-glucose 4-epimerase
MISLVTGGAGFIGSHLCGELLKKGDKVVAIDNLSTGSLENIKDFNDDENFEFVNGSILDEKLIDKFAERCDRIFHLAAAVGVKLIVENPLESMRTNIKGSEIVLQMACRYRKQVLVTSTSEIYGKNKEGHLKENDDRILGSPLKSRWSYSTSKAVDELLAYYYYKDKGIPTVIVRLFNTVGPRQTGNYGMVIPTFVSQALKNEPVTIYGTGKQKRCFLHVKDAVDALIKLVETPEARGDVFNIGSDQEISIEELAKKIVSLTGSSSEVTYIPYNEAYEEGFEDMERRIPDISKISGLIGFKVNYDLDAIIKSVVEYQKGAE